MPDDNDIKTIGAGTLAGSAPDQASIHVVGNLSKDLKRRENAAVCSVLIALWCLLGSLAQPYCSYGFIWRLDFEKNPCWLGLSLFTEHPVLLSVVIILPIIAGYLDRKFAPLVVIPAIPVREWIARKWLHIVLASSFVCVSTAMAVYAYAHNGYDLWIAEQFSEITVGGFPPTDEPIIEAPLDFLFLDKDSVDALYNQIEPELIEKRRTVSDSDKVSAKAGLESSGIAASVEGSKGENATGSYERIEFAPARRCLTVMKFVANSKRALYYTNFADWRRFRQTVDVILSPESKTGADSTDTKEDVKSKPRSEPFEKNDPVLNTALLKELQDLRGLVFVTARFSQSTVGQTTALTADFAGAPRKVLFRVVLPHDAPLPEPLRLAAGANLTVFGRVIKPLTEDGAVEIRPFAIF